MGVDLICMPKRPTSIWRPYRWVGIIVCDTGMGNDNSLFLNPYRFGVYCSLKRVSALLAIFAFLPGLRV